MARPLQKPRESYLINNPPRRKASYNKPKVKIVKRRKRFNPFAKLVSLLFCIVFLFYIFPFSYKKFIRPIVTAKSAASIKVDYEKLYSPTSAYLYNEIFLNKKYLVKSKTIKPQMQMFYQADPMYLLTGKLKALMKSYPAIDPAIYVWDFETGNYVDIKGTEQYPAASIIKIPVLLELFRSIELGQVNLQDKMVLQNYYRAEGSGAIQYALSGSKYSMDYLARTMIQDSDNSSTNMIMSSLGGKPAVNRAIRKWGLSDTYVETWLPDMSGNNKTTAKDIAVMLYNIDNSSFLSLKSRESIIDYMSNVKNDRLLKAGLPNDALIVHKTGDIGNILGDAGIVWSPNGKKYIVVIMAKRPYNASSGKEFIINASSLIYESIVSGNF